MSPDVLKTRWLRVLIWQLLSSTAIFITSKTLTLIFFSYTTPFLISLLCYLFFLLSLSLFLLALSATSTPEYHPAASPMEFSLGLFRSVTQIAIGKSPGFPTVSSRRRAEVMIGCVVFVVACAVAGGISVPAVVGIGNWGLKGLGFRGFVIGGFYGVEYVYKKRFVLSFPIIQRPLFFSFKMGLPASMKRALELSVMSLLCSTATAAIFRNAFETRTTIWEFIVQVISIYLATFVVYLCWELTHHLVQVLHTRRCIFAQSQGSAAAETNPSDILLVALEQSKPSSLYRYLSYLDLLMVLENNVDSWRRAAFFEESGETYKRVVSASLRPLEQLTSRIGEGLTGYALKSDLFSQQMSSTQETPMDLRVDETFTDFQLCMWCARALAALTVHSRKDDRYGVAQLTGCNSRVLMTLLSCLLSVEACLGKRTAARTLHPIGPASINWAAPAGSELTSRGRGVIHVLGRKKGTAIHGKAYAMADVFRTSIYSIVSSFHDEMKASLMRESLGKDWIGGVKPLYETSDVLVQKLSFFVEFRAS